MAEENYVAFTSAFVEGILYGKKWLPRQASYLPTPKQLSLWPLPPSLGPSWPTEGKESFPLASQGTMPRSAPKEKN